MQCMRSTTEITALWKILPGDVKISTCHSKQSPVFCKVISNHRGFCSSRGGKGLCSIFQLWLHRYPIIFDHCRHWMAIRELYFSNSIWGSTFEEPCARRTLSGGNLTLGQALEGYSVLGSPDEGERNLIPSKSCSTADPIIPDNWPG